MWPWVDYPHAATNWGTIVDYPHVKAHTLNVHGYQVDNSENLHKFYSDGESKTLEDGEEYESTISHTSLSITSTSSSSCKTSATSSNSADSLKS